jgi:flagellar biosynthesis protein FlhG
VTQRGSQPLISGPGLDDQATRLRALVQQGRASRPASITIEAPTRPAPATARVAVPVRFRRPAKPVITFTSGKGGVGKTNLAVNVACVMARRGVRVTLLDADLGLANADVLCGITPTTRLDAAVPTRPGAEPARDLRQLALTTPANFRLIPGAVGTQRLAAISAAERAGLWSSLAELDSDTDVFLIDTGAGMGETITGFVEPADLGVVVTTPEPSALADAYALIKCVALRRVGEASSGELAVVINMARTPEEAAAVHARLAAVCSRFLRFQPTLLGVIRDDDAVKRAVRARVPFMLADDAAQSPASVDVEALAGTLLRRLGIKAKSVAAPKPGFWKRLFGA